MENRTYENGEDELVGFSQPVVCGACGRAVSSSARTSNQGRFVCPYKSTRGSFPVNLATPTHVNNVETRSCKNASEGCSEYFLSTNDDHETLCDYRITYCKVLSCQESVLLKDILQHLCSEHESMLYTDESSAVECAILENTHYEIIPLYVLDTIIWEKITFENDDIVISFFHESPNKFTPRLLATVSIEYSQYLIVNTVRVLNYGEDPRNEVVTIPNVAIRLLKDVELYGGGSRLYGAPKKIKHGLQIIRLDMV